MVHNKLETNDKIQILSDFIAKKTPILIGTNVLKGANLEEVTHVINFDVPMSSNQEPSYNIFLRRNGRFADEPEQNECFAIHLVNQEEVLYLQRIAAHFQTNITLLSKGEIQSLR